ncbi:MAG: hypothetical protein RSA86_03705 [Christensenellaceae bacterium]
MTKVLINPGVCGFVTSVEAVSQDKMNVTVTVKSGCKSVMEMFEELGTEFDAFAVCLKKPGDNIFYEYAAKKFPVHAACPVIAGVLKCMEAECMLALPAEASIKFE